ncbi:MAG TPA: methionine adenosyltransferase [Candidatus Ratteibacteria bacterium]|jgi:S-adenosylmethionine synthetase|uniref:S-adenosylmethionine synthase n=1 Tax=candidate division TA06 bacterium ADurb.Bin131 TaxID=1852827 RepID=A0A1V6CDN3_UNCT6|nr:MAG: S-adenosylmethionine synthase [candidate division TA06 bacterium ADurb.Bin131]HOC01859.1 methionine adenosyltransferase [bacterium]HRS06033.1 methionine adenosyltransferase [Candidatus Ratteibacteria bacterium]HON04955.1 methionine adenosyltransferase [bacterium]HOQ82241.1 methionine adenosyltransferase [bacterium]
MKEFCFTSESVTEGHPDKICDQVSDAILDDVMRQDKKGRVACETLATRGLLFIAGEITTEGYVEIPSIVRNLLKEIGYTDMAYGFNYDASAIITAIQEQSPDIAQGVDTGGAGDQGMMFGYATNETPQLMPLPIMLAHSLVRRLAEVRKTKVLSYLRPDGKSQVTVRYQNNRPVEVVAVVLSSQHDDISQKKIEDDLRQAVVEYVIPKELLAPDYKLFINPTGRFVIGGPQADTGVTGRKIIVDTYGGFGKHGGGCFSGKDPTKVDRTASYFARYLAKNIVASGVASTCEIQLAYVIGQKQPVSIMVNMFGSEKLPEEKIVDIIRKNLDLSPAGMIEKLDLLRPIYRKTACYGHFGREESEFTWEKTDLVELFSGAL